MSNHDVFISRELDLYIEACLDRDKDEPVVAHIQELVSQIR